VQSGQVLLAEAEEFGGEEGRPLTDAVNRLAGHEEIGEEYEQGGDGREFGTRVVLGKMFAEDALQLHPLDDSVEQRQSPDVIGAELETVGLGVFAWDDLPLGAAWSGSRAIGHGFLFRHVDYPEDGQRRLADVCPGDQESRGVVKTEKVLQRLFYWSYDNGF
jgi:hypothetical protein